MSKLLDGREIAEEIKQEVGQAVRSFDNGIPPALAIILATEDESTHTYSKMIKKAGTKAGIKVEIIELEPNATTEELQNSVQKCAQDRYIHGIILQTPLPKNIDVDIVSSIIPAEKDVDGANPLSAGRLFNGLSAYAPATAQAVVEILKYYRIQTRGKHAVVIGRSNIVGKPAANMLLGLDATVTVCHSATKDLSNYTKQADILVVAAGKEGLIGTEHVDESKGSVIIDVGTNYNEEKGMVGDVRYEDLRDKVNAITPVPGGVGPVTVSILLRNTLEAYKSQSV